MPPLAIIGAGCLFPGSSDLAGFWARICGRHDAIREVPPTHWNPADYVDPDPKAPDRVYAARGGFLDPVPFQPQAFGIPPSNLEATDASQLLGLLVAQQALDDCGYVLSAESATSSRKLIDRSRVSVILGVTGTLQLVIPLGARLGHPLWRRALQEAGVPDDVAEDVVQRIADGYVPWQENSFPGLLGNVVAGRIANKFDFGGTNCVVDAACASSLSAIHLAALELATGRADLVLTGGVDTFNDIFMFTCFSKTPALSPTGNARPFDANGDGTILGEGLGMVVLKRLDDARRDGDRIYAVFKGVGSSSDGRGGAIYAPRKEGQIEALQNAYRVSGVSPETIELVEAHGTGTRVGDATEISALTEVYARSQRKRPWCAVGSIKSQIGHTKAAAGVAGLLKVTAALYHKVLPPTIKVETPLEVLRDPECPLYVNTVERPWMPSAEHPRRAAVSAFGFGGSNFHAVLEEADPNKPGIDWTGNVQLVAFAAATADALREQLQAWPASLRWQEFWHRADQSRRDWDPALPWRLILVVDRERFDWSALVARVLPLLQRDPVVGLPLEGIHLSNTSERGRLGVLFPGQGSQYVGMLRELVCHFPQAFEAFVAAGKELADIVYPPPAFTAEGKSAQEAALRATDRAQPALGAVSLGAWRVLEGFGVHGEAFAGHSFGELTALCAAGWLPTDDFFRLARLRGQLMAQAGSGAMLAVKTDASTLAQLLGEANLELVLANKNSPTQTVLSGEATAIERASVLLAARQIPSVRLAVAAAFHSPLVAAAREPFAQALRSVPFTAGTTVFANSTAEPYPHDASAARELLAGQLARPVEWVRLIEAMYDSGIRQFIEVGPAGKLAGLVESILADRPASILTLDPTAGKRSGWLDLANTLAALAVRRHPIDLALWDPVTVSNVVANKPGLTVELNGANYVKPRPPRPANRTQPQMSSHSDRNGSPKYERPVPTPTPTPAPSSPSASSVRSATPSASTIEPNALQRALELTRESLASLQQMQEQTAKLHRQFLEGQEQAQRTVHLLVEQQQRLIHASLGLPQAPVPLPTPASTSAPLVVSPPAPQLPAVSPTPSGVPTLARPTTLQSDATTSPTPPPMAPSSPTQAKPSPVETGVESILLEVIAEKTGYPVEMLELTMSLDTDLGIDSIKRVEILSALQERLPDAPAVKPEHLGTLHTLGDISQFLSHQGSLNGQKSGPVAELSGQKPDRVTELPRVPVEPVKVTPSAAALQRSVVQVTELIDRLRPQIELSGDSELWLSDDGSVLANELVEAFQSRGFRVRRVALTALPTDSTPKGLILLAPETALTDIWLCHALLAVQRCGSSLRQRGLLATISRLDGAFGLGGGSPWREPIDGGLAGLAKTVQREWPEVYVKALDVAPNVAAARIVEELLLAGPVEVGLTASTVVTLTEVLTPATGGAYTPIQSGEVVVISGGARGVTAEVAVALAEAFRPTLVLLGRSPMPEDEPAELAGITDEAELRRELSRRRPGSSPRALAEQARAILAAREIRQTLRRIGQTGTKAIYQSVDVRDPEAVSAALSRVRQQHGPIRGIIHGAGVLADARIEDKTVDQFDDVYQTKVAGVRALLAGAAADDLRLLVLFSSSTARFGRVGQVDYAIANEVLNKLAWYEAARRPGCQVVSMNWGPWDGGMVHAGLKQLFAKEGVGVIPLADGAKLLVDELRAGPTGPREIVVLAGASAKPSPLPPALPLAFERVLHLAEYPVLKAHILDGRPVLPAALMLEWLAHAALVQNPGLAFHGCNDLRVLQGVILEGDAPTLRVGADKATRSDGLFFVTTELRSVRSDGKETLHARAEIVLTTALPAAPEAQDPPLLPEFSHPCRSVYERGILFHGAALQGLTQIEGSGEPGILGLVRAAPVATEWMRQPLRKDWLADPLVLDGAFQLAIVWSNEHRGAGSLPVRLTRYRQYRRNFPSETRVLLSAQRVTELQATFNVEFIDPEGRLIARLEGYECVIDPNLSRAFRRNARALA